MNILSIKNLNTGYDKKHVLFDVSLDIDEGATVLLVGSNGSGKSTLLKAIAGLLPLWNGEVYFQNECIQSVDKKNNESLIKKGLVYIPQKNGLFADMTVIENLKMSLLHLKDKRESESRITELMEQMPLLKAKYKQTADRLSGGEAKLLSIGMAMVNQPKILLFDEPLAGLSSNNINLVLQYIEQLKQNNITLVLVEHKVKELFSYADTIIGLKLGYLHINKLNSIDNIKQFMI